MRFVSGVVADGVYRVLVGEGAPSLQDVAEVPPGSREFGWGRGAQLSECVCTATAILQHLTDKAEAQRMAVLFAEEVVSSKFETGKMWILSYDDIRAWLENHRMVV